MPSQRFEVVPFTGDGQPCPKTYTLNRGVTLICQLPVNHPLAKRHQAVVLIWADARGSRTPFTVYWPNRG